jgi:hypothetical protein
VNPAAFRGSRHWRRLGLRPRRLILPPAAALVPLMLAAPASLAVPAGGISTPQPTRVERFNPDQRVCQPLAIKEGFARQLQPWADQPPAVLEQLRRVQLEMTRATLQRCVSKGLLQPTEASQLERDLGLQAGSESAASPIPAAAPSGR